MAAYASYRHIEIDNVGCGKRRITKPPGGETSDIFTNPSNSTPPSTPRKVKNYMASNIFTPTAPVQPVEPRSVNRHRPDDDSFKRLFGAGNNGVVLAADAVDGPQTPRGKDNQKSNVLLPAGEKPLVVNGNGHGPIIGNGFTSPKALPGDGHDSGSSSGNSSGSATPNGSVNGDAEPARITNGSPNGVNGTAPVPTRRVPPGGHCTQLW
jgi:hypothetical protein